MLGVILSHTFQAVEGGDFRGNAANLTGIGRAERVSVAYCTPTYLTMLGGKPHTVAGILPLGFSMTPWEMRVDLWTAHAHDAAPGTRCRL